MSGRVSFSLTCEFIEYLNILRFKDIVKKKETKYEISAFDFGNWIDW